MKVLFLHLPNPLTVTFHHFATFTNLSDSFKLIVVKPYICFKLLIIS